MTNRQTKRQKAKFQPGQTVRTGEIPTNPKGLAVIQKVKWEDGHYVYSLLAASGVFMTLWEIDLIEKN